METQSEHWSNYWACGYITSLPQDFAGNYDGEIRSFWHARFAAAPHAARVLDLCTGNGAIALLAVAWSRAHSAALQVTAIDAAAIDPQTLLEHHPGAAGLIQEVRFIGNTAVESCGLPTAGFDLLTSQYGIEYCEPESAAMQVARMLVPGGCFAMLTHDSGSKIVSTMEAEDREYSLLVDLGLFRAMADFLAGLTDAGSLRESLQAQRLQLAGEPASPLFATVRRMIDSLLALDETGLVAGHAGLQRSLSHLEHARARLADMLRVNRMISEDPHWYRVFERHGLVLRDRGEVMYRGLHRSGHYYCFNKPLPDAA